MLGYSKGLQSFAHKEKYYFLYGPAGQGPPWIRPPPRDQKKSDMEGQLGGKGVIQKMSYEIDSLRNKNVRIWAKNPVMEELNLFRETFDLVNFTISFHTPLIFTSFLISFQLSVTILPDLVDSTTSPLWGTLNPQDSI